MPADVVDREKAAEPTAPMTTEAVKAGYYEPTLGSTQNSEAVALTAARARRGSIPIHRRYSREPMPIRQICRSILLTVIIALGLPNRAAAQTPDTQLRAIPEDNLAYPVLIILKNNGKGSGFFLNTPTTLYLVTANHVIADDTTLVDPATKTYKPDAESALSLCVRGHKML